MGRKVTIKKVSSKHPKYSKYSGAFKRAVRGRGAAARTSVGGGAAAAVMSGNGIVMPTVVSSGVSVLRKPGFRTRPSGGSREGSRESFGSRALAHLKSFALNKSDETAYFEPKAWSFWRGIVMYIFLFSIIGHWMEIPYCLTMHSLFGIVEPDYAIWADPLYVPYWVYGVGAAIITLLLLPLKIKIVGKRKTIWGAALEFFVVAVVMCAAMECIMGWIINQPNELGEYPYWDNSVLPLNIFGQAWLVNDVCLGFISLAYVWVIFPFCQKACKLIGNRASNRVFAMTCVLCAVVCVATYSPYWML